MSEGSGAKRHAGKNSRSAASLGCPQKRGHHSLDAERWPRKTLRARRLTRRKDGANIMVGKNEYIFSDEDSNIIEEACLSDDDVADTLCLQLAREHKISISCYRFISIYSSDDVQRAAAEHCVERTEPGLTVTENATSETCPVCHGAKFIWLSDDMSCVCIRCNGTGHV